MGRPRDITKGRKIATKLNGIVVLSKDQAKAFVRMLETAIPHMSALWSADMTKEKRRYMESLESKLLDAKDIINA
jgi:hypothetical protein